MSYENCVEFEAHHSYLCFTCGKNMAAHSEEWMARGQLWKLYLGVGQKGRGKCVNCHNGVLADGVSLLCQSTIRIPSWTYEKLESSWH